MQVAIALPAKSGLTAAVCAALGLARANVYRWPRLFAPTRCGAASEGPLTACARIGRTQPRARPSPHRAVRGSGSRRDLCNIA